MNKHQIEQMLQLHKMWLENDKDGHRAYLRYADLSHADLSHAYLRGANLSGANLSGTKGLLNSQLWIQKHFSQDDLGIIVFKRIGVDKTFANPPDDWIIAPGRFLVEVCSPCRTIDCACGVNFGTLGWCGENYTNADLWRCRIRWIDLAGVIVPYNTDGKARCNRLELIEVVNDDEGFNTE